MISKVFKFIFRNHYSRNGEKLPKNKVHLEYYKDATNLGDLLSPVIYKYMLEQRSLTADSPAVGKKPTHITALGSLLGGRGDFDMTVWGSGLMRFSAVKYICRRKVYQKLDVRAVRGPVTGAALEDCGIACPKVYGDPAILMPLIYSPTPKERKGTVLITHYLTPTNQYSHLENLTFLNIQTADYKTFIDTIASAEKVISSSLHGIILAETYGTPAVFMKKGVESVLLKFYDWYYSTGRYNVKVASDIQEALAIEPMPLPDLKEMQTAIMAAFPYDLWKQSEK